MRYACVYGETPAGKRVIGKWYNLWRFRSCRLRRKMRNARNRNFRQVYARGQKRVLAARFGRSATARASEKRRRCTAARSRREAWKPQMCAKVALRSHCFRNKGGILRDADDSRLALSPSASEALSDTLRKRPGTRRRLGGDDRGSRMYCALNAHVLDLPLRTTGILQETKHVRARDDTALNREAHAADLLSTHCARHSRVSIPTGRDDGQCGRGVAVRRAVAVVAAHCRG